MTNAEEARLARWRRDLEAEGIEEFRIRAFEERYRAGDFANARRIVTKPICGARRKKGRGFCLVQFVKKGGRCRLHGMYATGPRTEAGKDRIREANRRRWAQWRIDRAQER